MCVQVAVAMERDEGEDTMEWVHYQARRRQALSDARTFETALRSAQEFHQVSLHFLGTTLCTAPEFHQIF